VFLLECYNLFTFSNKEVNTVSWVYDVGEQSAGQWPVELATSLTEWGDTQPPCLLLSGIFSRLTEIDVASSCICLHCMPVTCRLGLAIVPLCRGTMTNTLRRTQAPSGPFEIFWRVLVILPEN